MTIEEIEQIVVMKNNLQPIKITNGWKVVWNHFSSSDPMDMEDNSREWIDFSEDMAYFQNDKYEIDLGWYGGLNKDGYYSISLLENHKNIESFTSKNIEEITTILNYFFAVPYL